MTRRDIVDFLKNIIASLLIGSLTALTGSFIVGHIIKKPQHEITFSNQLKTLDEVSKNLATLQRFVSNQKDKLIESEKTLTKLKDEEKILRPAIEADRKTIEAIIKLQSDIAGRNIWLERSIAFLLGVLSSLFATIIIGFLKRKD